MIYLQGLSTIAEIVATGRKDWIGWFELKQEPIKVRAIDTARVFHEQISFVLKWKVAYAKTVLDRLLCY